MAKYNVGDIVKALRESKGMVYVAARKVGCAPNTIYNYAKKHASVQNEINNQRGLMVDAAEMALYKALVNGEAWAVSLTLKTIGKSRGYVEKLVIEHNVPPGLVNSVIKAAAAAGVDPSQLFEDMLNEIARQSVDAGHEVDSE